MDSTHISDPHYLFAYCITDGILDEMSPEQRASIISIIESLLSEGEDANNESLLSGEDANNESLLSGEDANNESLLSGEEDT